MSVHPGAFVAAAAAVAAYLAVGVPASGDADATPSAQPGAVQCPHDARSTLTSQPLAAAASVEATVPRMTFLTSTGTGWIVRTNTEAPPDPRDQFVVLTGGGSSTATAALERLVLAACG